VGLRLRGIGSVFIRKIQTHVFHILGALFNFRIGILTDRLSLYPSHFTSHRTPRSSSLSSPHLPSLILWVLCGNILCSYNRPRHPRDCGCRDRRSRPWLAGKREQRIKAKDIMSEIAPPENLNSRMASIERGQLAMNNALGLMLDTLQMQTNLLSELADLARVEPGPSPVVQSLDNLTSAVEDMGANVEAVGSILTQLVKTAVTIDGTNIMPSS
jgi:hypothetical protein